MAEMARSLMDYVAPPVARANAVVSPARPMSIMDYISELDLLRMLEGTSIPERAAVANDLLNPLAAIPRAQAASQEMFAPDRSIMQRITSAGNMLGEVGGVAVPMVASARAGVPAATAVMEGLLGGSPTTQAASDAARGFLADESGAVPLPLACWPYHPTRSNTDEKTHGKIHTLQGVPQPDQVQGDGQVHDEG